MRCSHLILGFSRSGSRQDFRGMTLPIETLDEFRYPNLESRRRTRLLSTIEDRVNRLGMNHEHRMIL